MYLKNIDALIDRRNLLDHDMPTEKLDLKLMELE